MADEIRIGDRAVAVTALRPLGTIRLGTFELDATSPTGWVDAGAQVVVIGGTTRCLIVQLQDDQPIENEGQPIPSPVALEETPLDAPAAWSEKGSAAGIGFVFGIGVMALGMLVGWPWNPSAILLPIAGSLSGSLYLIFVRAQREVAGPREDHRTSSNQAALAIILCGIIGLAVGWGTGGNYLGASAGLLGGTLIGGVLTWASIILSRV